MVRLSYTKGFRFKRTDLHIDENREEVFGKSSVSVVSMYTKAHNFVVVNVYLKVRTYPPKSYFSGKNEK